MIARNPFNRFFIHLCLNSWIVSLLHISGIILTKMWPSQISLNYMPVNLHVHFAKLIQKRFFIYFMNDRLQILSSKNLKTFGLHSQMSTKSFYNETSSLGSQGKLLTYFIILAKLHVWSSRHCARSPNFDVFKEMVKYRTEKYIASKNNMERKVFLMKMFSCNSFTCL